MTTQQQQHDAVNHPSHYTQHPSGVECITITEHFPFNVGNAVKYLWRAGLKSADPLEDLCKAVWYVRREIERLEEQVKEVAPKSKAKRTPKGQRKRCRIGKTYRSKLWPFEAIAISQPGGGMVRFRMADGSYLVEPWGDGSAYEEVALGYFGDGNEREVQG